MNKNRQIIGELQVYLYTIGQVDHSVSVLFNKECRSLCHRTVISRSKEIPFRSINHKIYIRIQIPEIIPPNLFSGICHFHQIFFIVGQAPNAARNYYRTYCCSAIKTYLCSLESIHNQNDRKR